MKSLIVSIALALSMVAVAFAAIPTTAAVYYTGSVQVTDGTGAPRNVFFYDPVSGDSERIYVNVSLEYMGVPTDMPIEVELIGPTGNVEDWLWANTNDPATGEYHSWSAAPWAQWLNTGYVNFGDQSALVMDVVLLANTGWWTEIARSQIVLKMEGLTLSPPPSPWYYPGEQITMSLVTRQTDEFYVQIVNDTDHVFGDWNNQLAVDGSWVMEWTLPSNAPDGIYYVYVKAQADDTIWYSASFNVQMYVLQILVERSYVLPGETIWIYYEMINLSDLGSVTGATIEWNANYENDTAAEMWIHGTFPGTSGTTMFTVPSDIALYSNVYMTFWGNGSGGRSYVDYETLYIYQLGGSIDLDDTSYSPGDIVTVSVGATISWQDVMGANVDIAVEYNGTAITGYGVSNLMTDRNGVVQHQFVLATNAAEGSYLVTATISKSGFTVTKMTSFDVIWSGSLTVEFANDYYYSGETAEFSFTTVWNNVESPASSVYYMVYDGSFSMIGSDTTTTDTGSYDIPVGYVDWIYVQGVVNLHGRLLFGQNEVYVRLADIVIQPGTDSFRPGETIAWAYNIQTGLTSGALSYVVVDDNGDVVASEDLTFAKSGTVSYVVPYVTPGADASARYTITMTLNDGTGNSMTESSTVYLTAVYEINAVRETNSNFVNGAFDSGTKLSFSFTIDTHGAEDLPVYYVYIWVTGADNEQRVLLTTDSGTFEYTIPDDAVDGWYWVDFNLYDGVTGNYLSGDEVSFEVKAHQSAWDSNVGGLSMFNFVLLLLVIILLIVLIVLPFLKGRIGGGKAKAAPLPPPPAEQLPPP
jgi:hypothetical protein